MIPTCAYLFLLHGIALAAPFTHHSCHTSSRSSSNASTFQTSLSTISYDPNGIVYTARIGIGTQSFNLMIDTGSSDTWVDGLNTSDMFTALDQHLRIDYLDKTWAEGIFGIDSVTIAGITVPEQQIAAAQAGNASTGGSYEGLLGLSFPGLTRAYPGLNFSADHNGVEKLFYSPIINTIFRSDPSIRPIFSLALNRNPSAIEDNGGILAIGGTPDFLDPTVNITSSLASAPIKEPYNAYNIAVDSIMYGNETLDANSSWFVDCGTSLMLVPAASAASLYSQFEPPGVIKGSEYMVDCDAEPPRMAVTVVGQDFFINPADMILEPGVDGLCTGGIQTSVSDLNILGLTFLKNVLVVFDWGNVVIDFAAREYYSS